MTFTKLTTYVNKIKINKDTILLFFDQNKNDRFFEVKG